jgi:hypothetical protein
MMVMMVVVGGVAPVGGIVVVVAIAGIVRVAPIACNVWVACWLPSIGYEAKSNATAAVKVLNMMVVFGFIDI